METISIDDIRERLAQDDADSYIEEEDLFQIFLHGCTGYLHYSDEECLDWYIQKGFFYDSLANLIDPEKIAIVLGSDGKPKFEVFRECQDVYFKEINS